MLSAMEIGILGATGPAGRGLAARLADVGHVVIAGSRDLGRAEGAVAKLHERWGDRVASVRPATNDEAAIAADLVFVATTWEGAVGTAATHAAALAGRVVVSMANALEKVDDEFRPVLPEEGSIAVAIQAAAPQARVVSAFHLITAAAFLALDRPLESDVIVCADDAKAGALVRELVAGIPDLGAFDGGSLANSVGLEAFTAVLLTVNLRHKGAATLRLSGVERRDPG
jgi:NADPH-dependent F420 reductase